MDLDLIEAIKLAVREAIADHNASPWFNTRQAASYIGCTPKTLKTWRSVGAGPRYHVIHNKLIRYHRDELDAFVNTEAP